MGGGGGGWIKLDYAHHNVSHGGWGGGVEWIKLDYAHHNVSHEMLLFL